MKYLLGIDFGGGASKATLIDVNGSIVAENTVEYPTLYPTQNACEQNPSDWIEALCKNSRAVLSKSGIAPSDIVSVAIDSATHTAVLCDENMRPVRNAVHWTDTRSREEAKEIEREYGDFIFKTMFHRPDTIWTLPELYFLKKTEPETFKKVRHIMFEKDYIRLFLTDVFCTDHIEAQGSMLYDPQKREWSKELCAILGIDISVLPPLFEPTDVIGKVTSDAAEKTGLCEGTPVICGTTDTVMEVFASKAVSSGDITVKLATAGRICVITDAPFPHKHLINYPHVVKGLWYPGTATKSCAASYRWYRDTFGGDYKELDAGADKVALGSDGLIFHPYLNGELTPYADPMLCGSFTGIRATHTRGHFTRALLEGVCFSLLDSKKLLDSLKIPYNDTATLIGGGAKGKIWRQITADVLGITLRTTESSDSSLGSAMLAGVAMGVFDSFEKAAETCVKSDKIVTPNLENTEKYQKIFEEYKAIHDALAPIYQKR